MNLMGIWDGYSTKSVSFSYQSDVARRGLKMAAMAITGGKAATSFTFLSSHHNTKFTATKYPRNAIFTLKNARKTLSSLHFQGQVAGSKLQAIAASSPSDESENQNVPLKSVSVILLAGGKGKRMGANIPKQYLPLLGRPIVLYSFSTFSIMPEVKEIIVVCDPSYRGTFEDASQTVTTTIKFASPGQERQDSVFNGLKEVDDIAELVCVHDSARPLVLSDNIKQVFKDAWIHGAAVLGVPTKATIKEANTDGFVVRTLNRATLWEMQTPQVMKPNLLRNGFEVVYREGLQVTDDVSIVEHLKQPVYITQGCYTNIKVTTPDDLIMAETILNRK